MKKYLLAGTLVLFALQACEKNNSDEPAKFVNVGLTDNIRISGVEGYDIDGVTDIALVARFHGHGGGYGSTLNDEGVDTRVMVRGIAFDSGSMTLELPADPPQELLRNITLDFPTGFTYSDTEAQTIACVEIACNLTEENHFYLFLYRYLDAGDGVYYTVKYIYCDRPVTVTGTAPDWWGQTATYDLNLEKGWNTYVEKDIRYETERYSIMNHMMPVAIKWRQSAWIGGY